MNNILGVLVGLFDIWYSGKIKSRHKVLSKILWIVGYLAYLINIVSFTLLLILKG